MQYLPFVNLNLSTTIMFPIRFVFPSLHQHFRSYPFFSVPYRSLFPPSSQMFLTKEIEAIKQMFPPPISLLPTYQSTNLFIQIYILTIYVFKKAFGPNFREYPLNASITSYPDSLPIKPILCLLYAYLKMLYEAGGEVGERSRILEHIPRVLTLK